MDLGRMIEALAPAEVVNRDDVDVRDLAYDSRHVERGALFFCVRGEHVDGHRFAREVVERGAVALVVEEAQEVDVPQLVVADSRRAMASGAAAFFGDPSHDLLLAGVTGTNGKTTTSFLVFAMLAAAGRRPGLLGTIESRVGGERRHALRTTPEAIELQRTLREMLDVGDRSCALEATSHGAALGRLDHVRFAALVFTNLSHDHLDFHGTLDAYYEAKRHLFFSADEPPAAINIGDVHGRRLVDELRASGRERVMTFGRTADAEIWPDDLELSAEGARFTAAGMQVRTHLLGSFNVDNVLAAIAAARLLGLPDEAIVAGIGSVRGVPGRFEPVEAGQPYTVVVDYAHTPDSLTNVLRTARELTEGDVVCVFGCGGDRDREKRPLMGRAASEHADAVIVTSDNPRSEDPEAIVAEILRGTGDGVEVVLDRRLAIERALDRAGPGDIVVIAGKGHELGQEAAGVTVPFDDREVVRDLLGANA